MSENLNTAMIDHQYEGLLRETLCEGVDKGDRTGTGTYSLFGRSLRYDLSERFPLITTKRVAFKTMAHELLWFLRGETNIRFLQAEGVKIWDEWADANGDLGPVYGRQWRNWGGEGIDQIADVIHTLRTNPDSRRMIVSAWNVSDLGKMALEPCHAFFQFYVADGRLSCQVYQRSADLFLGVPFNIASYALLTRMVADQTGHAPGDLIWVGGDCHIYSNHVEQVREQLSRDPYPFPKLTIQSALDIDSYTIDSFSLQDYAHHPAIKAPVAI